MRRIWALLHLRGAVKSPLPVTLPHGTPRAPGCPTSLSSEPQRQRQLNGQLLACQNVRELLQTVSSEAPHLNDVNVATALYRLPQLLPKGMRRQGGADELKMTLPPTEQHQQQPPSQQRGQETGILASAHPSSSATEFVSVGTHISAAKARMPAATLSTDLGSDPTVAHLATCAQQQCRSSSTRAIHSSLQGLTKIIQAAPSHVLAASAATLVDELTRRQDVDARVLHGLFWTMAHIAHLMPSEQLPSLWAAVLRLSLSKDFGLNERNVAVVAWALTRAPADVDRSLLHDAASHAITMDAMSTFSDATAVTVLWALAVVQFPGQQLITQLQTSLQHRVPRLDAQQLASVCWACAHGPWYHESLIKAVNSAVLSVAGLCSDSRYITNILWAQAALRIDNRPLLSRLEQLSMEHALRLDARDKVGRLFSFATLGHVPQQLMSPPYLLDSVHALETMSSHTLSNYAWSLVCLEHPDTDLLLRILRVALCRPASARVEEIGQLAQLVVELRIRSRSRAMSAEDCSLLETASHVFRPAFAPPAQHTATALEWQVYEALCRLLPAELLAAEHPVEGVYRVDVAVPSRCVAIEANGPFHYLRHSDGVLMASMVLRDRHVRALGWQVCHVPYYEWYPLAPSDRVSYLRAKLRGVLDV